jgi:DNA-directed RNA polymerase specialized sigma24 family protein
MSAEGSITRWLGQLRDGDSSAAAPLWQRYFSQLVARARAALGAAPRRAADEEDVALSAFDSFCRGAEQGRFPRLEDRNDLWQVLLLLAARKAAHQIRDERRAKRGGGTVLAEADLHQRAEEDETLLAQVMGKEPTPELAASVVEECRRLLDKLGDSELRSIAVWQMEGYTVEEIAAKLGRSVRTVARKLTIIRGRWQREGSPS